MASSSPIGSILAFAGVFDDSPQSDWRLCAGQTLRRSDFPDLFKVVGTAWGDGDNPGSTFNLPDLRGLFLRGVANGVSTDPERDARTASIPGMQRAGGNAGDRVGSLQDDQLQAHGHTEAHPGHDHPGRTMSDGGHTHRVDIQRNSICGSNNTRDADGDTEKWNADPTLGSISASIPDNSGGHSHSVATDPRRVSVVEFTATTAGSVRQGQETRPANAYVNWIIRVK